MKHKSSFVFQIFLFILLLAAAAFAQSDSTASSPEMTAAAGQTVTTKAVNAIAAKVMAPCCWSETADVHNSEAAENVKAYIRAGLVDGQTESRIIDGLVARYGERILAKPVAKGFNLMAWILPALMFVVGGFGVYAYIRRVNDKSEPTLRPAAKTKTPSVAQDDYEARLERELEEFDK